MNNDLNAAERLLIDAVNDGKPAKLSENAAFAKSDMNIEIRAEVLRDVMLERRVDRLQPPGVVLHGARVIHRLDLTDITAPVSLKLLRCRLTDPVVLHDTRLPSLTLYESEITSLKADGVHLENGLNAEGLRCSGSISLIGARIGGQASFVGARLGTEITDENACALIADRLELSDELLLRDGFHATGGRSAVRLPGAHISGNLDCDSATMVASHGPALDAERVTIGGNVLLRTFEGKSAVAANTEPASHIGVVILRGARVKGQLSCAGAQLSGSGVSAIAGDGLQIDGDVFLSHLSAEGSGRDDVGVVRLLGGRIGGHLVCDGGKVCPTDHHGTALDLRFASVGKALSLPVDFVDRPLQAKAALDGLTYPMEPQGMTRKEWIDFLRDRMPAYAAQPYQQLAAAYHAAGRDEDARTVLIAQQDHLLHDGGLPWQSRLRLRLLKLTLGYGYKTWRALVCLGITFLLAVIMVLVAAQTTNAVRTPPRLGTPRHAETAPCPIVEQVGLGFDLAIPLINTTTRQRCNVIATKSSEQWLEVLGWCFQILGWAFATLLAAGYTGLIRKSNA